MAAVTVAPTTPPRGTVRCGGKSRRSVARRAVTRNTIKRQIYAAGSRFESGLPAAAHVVRLRTAFDRKVYVSATSDVLKQAVRQELRARFPSGFDNAPFEIHDRDDTRRVATEQWAEQNRAGTTAVVLIGVFLVLGAANSVSVAQFDRRNEFRGMRLLGFTWRQIHRTVTAETVLTVTLAFGVAVLVVLWIAVLTALRSGAAALSLLPQLLRGHLERTLVEVPQHHVGGALLDRDAGVDLAHPHRTAGDQHTLACHVLHAVVLLSSWSGAAVPLSA